MYNAALHACARERRWEDALRAFEALRASGGTPDVISYAAVVAACASCAQWPAAAALADEMVRACAGVGVVPAANILLAMRRRRAWHRPLMSVVSKAAIVAFEADRGWAGGDRHRVADRIALALEGLDGGGGGGGGGASLAPGPADAFVACAQRGDWDALECIVHQCAALGSPIGMDAVRRAVDRARGTEDTARLMAALRSTSRGAADAAPAFDPAALSCELAAKTAKAGLPEDALRIMRGVVADAGPARAPAGPFNCVIRSFAARGDHEGACGAMRAMQGAGVAWNRGTVHAALGSILHCRDGELALLAFEQSVGQARTPAVRKAVADTLRLCGRDEEARAVLDDEYRSARRG